MSKTFICSRCGREHPVSERRTFDGQELCQNCYDTETCLCDHCGSRIWASDSCGDENYSLCHACEDQYYGRCSDCGRLVLRENLRHLVGAAGDESYCEACFDRLSHKPDEEQEPIHRYWYKPRPIFYGEGSRYLGVELEVDEGGESNDEARRLLDVENRTFDHIYIKHDGSLTNGFEIVTHPMTLAYHQTEMPWNNHIVPQIMPPPDGSKTCDAVLEQYFHQARRDSAIPLIGFDDRLTRRTELLDQIAELEREQKQIEQEVKLFMKDNEIAGSDCYRVSWANVDTARLDTKRLKAEKPEIYQDFVKVTPSRRLSIRVAN